MNVQKVFFSYLLIFRLQACYTGYAWEVRKSNAEFFKSKWEEQ